MKSPGSTLETLNSEVGWVVSNERIDVIVEDIVEYDKRFRVFLIRLLSPDEHAERRLTKELTEDLIERRITKELTEDLFERRLTKELMEDLFDARGLFIH